MKPGGWFVRITYCNQNDNDMTIQTTQEERNAYFNLFDGVSDWYPHLREEGRFVIEWCGPYGRHRAEYVSEEARYRAVEEHYTHMNAWVLEYRKEKAVKATEKSRKARLLRESRTLGGQFPQLAELRASLR